MTGDTGDTGDVGEYVALWRLSKTRSNGDCSSADESLRTLRFSTESFGRGGSEVSSSSIMAFSLVSEYPMLKLEVDWRKAGVVLASEIEDELPFLVTTMLLSYKMSVSV